MTRRSSLESLPPETLAAVHTAIREGATIDEIVARIRARGGTNSRSAVARYVARMRDVLRRRSEVADLADLRRGTLGDRSDGGGGRLLGDMLRALATRAAIAIENGEKPPYIGMIGALALVLQRIESTVRTPAGRTGLAAQGRGLSPRTAAHIRAAVEGHDPAENGEEISPETVARIRTAVADHWGIGGPETGEE